MTSNHNDLAITVTAAWNDWRAAHARLGDLHDAHWHQPIGAPQPILHAYLSCADIVSGALSHACESSSAPHRVRVCILKHHSVPTAYAELARRAGVTAPPLTCLPPTGRVRRLNAIPQRQW